MNGRAILGLALATLTACGGSSSPSVSGAPSPTTSPPAAPPTFVQVKSAIESTGVTLCDNSEPGNVHERIFGKSTDGTCSDTAGAGLVYVFADTDDATFADDKHYARTADGTSWTYGTRWIVIDQNPAPGEDEALGHLGFNLLHS